MGDQPRSGLASVAPGQREATLTRSLPSPTGTIFTNVALRSDGTPVVGGALDRCGRRRDAQGLVGRSARGERRGSSPHPTRLRLHVGARQCRRSGEPRTSPRVSHLGSSSAAVGRSSLRSSTSAATVIPPTTTTALSACATLVGRYKRRKTTSAADCGVGRSSQRSSCDAAFAACTWAYLASLIDISEAICRARRRSVTSIGFAPGEGGRFAFCCCSALLRSSSESARASTAEGWRARRRLECPDSPPPHAKEEAMRCLLAGLDLSLTIASRSSWPSTPRVAGIGGVETPEFLFRISATASAGAVGASTISCRRTPPRAISMTRFFPTPRRLTMTIRTSGRRPYGSLIDRGERGYDALRGPPRGIT